MEINIRIHSRRLRNYEINYTITELECLAIIDSLDKFHYYLHESHFTVHTDHNALVWLKNFKIPTDRLFRWSLKVSMYDFDIKYKKCSTNIEADMSSRHPIAYHIINTPPEPLLDINEISHFQNIKNTSAPKCFKRDGVFVVKRQGLAKIIVPKALRLKLMETTPKKFGHPGPYTVLRKCSDVLFEIDRPNALNKTDTELVQSVRLRHFHPSENFQMSYIQQNTHNNEKKIITKRNLLRNTEVTEFCLTRLFGEKE
ncbi:transposon Tf2-9 polyprotein [Trichonephila clavipes]|nr:transposon Tf2-9 polyprotein [Trichonephila clavipes]